jgi:hypothetical protein
MAGRQVTTGVVGKDLVFSKRPQDLPREWYATWDALVTDMRKESAALPMNTMMTLLLERIATSYVMARIHEDADDIDLEQQRSMQKLWLNFVSEFSTQLHRNSQTPEQRFMAAFKAAVTTAVRKVGPDATVRELLPVLAEELNEFDV